MDPDADDLPPVRRFYRTRRPHIRPRSYPLSSPCWACGHPSMERRFVAVTNDLIGKGIHWWCVACEVAWQDPPQPTLADLLADGGY